MRTRGTARQPAAPMLLPGHLKMLLLPQPMHPLEVDTPSGSEQHRVDTLAAASRMGLHQPTHLLKQSPIHVWPLRPIPLGAPGLAQRLAGPTLRGRLMPQATTDLLYRSASPLGAHQFGRLASFRICTSSAWSATRRFNRAFSFSNALS